MFSRAGRIRLLVAIALSLLAAAGCDHAGRLPTSTSSTRADRLTAAPPLHADDAGARDTNRRAVIPEAREALGAILTGEQVYYQRFATFIEAGDASAIGALLGVELGELGGRWAFSVSNVSETGFVANARGLEGTRAQGFVVTLDYARGRPNVWRLRVNRRGGLRHSPTE